MTILRVDYEVTNNVKEIKKGSAETSLDQSTKTQHLNFKKVFSHHKVKVDREISLKEKPPADSLTNTNKNKVKSKLDFDHESFNFQSIDYSSSFLSSEMLKKLDNNQYREQQNLVQKEDSNYFTIEAVNKSNDVLNKMAERIQQLFFGFNQTGSQQTVSGSDDSNKDGFFSSKLLDQENNNIQTLMKDYIKLLDKQFSNLTLPDGKSIETLSTEVLKTGKMGSGTQDFFVFADSKIRRDFGISFDHLRSIIADLDKQGALNATSGRNDKNTEFTLQADDFHRSRTQGLVKQILVSPHDRNSTLENETITPREFRGLVTSPESVTDRQGGRFLSEIADGANLSTIKVVDLKDSANVGTTYVEKFAHLKNTIGPELIRHSNILIREGGGEIKLLLRPESMGNVRINITIENGSLEGKIMVENTIVRDLIEHNLPSLRNTLKSEGFNTLSLDVSVGDDKNKSELPKENHEMAEVPYEFDSDDKIGLETGFLTDQVIDLVV